METSRAPYLGHTEEVDGFDDPPGAIYTFAESGRAYRFDIAERSTYASCLPSLVEGREVTIMVNAPHSPTSPAIQIPTNCAVFQAALVELGTLGVKYVSFFNQPSGGFKQFEIRELRDGA
ncbi:MAG: hypothetical protein NVV69_18735 [Methyloversatilis sp.]|uniref:hypothetical protein n=1 Tax=unclassified Methyloversatilis TaxID=2639971 RepID=UPI0025F7AFE2|nr:hypothetical protein [Methyloversatilis sp.]MCR6667997.1 hypothetical protein [Methyloversatilis sp.]